MESFLRRDLQKEIYITFPLIHYTLPVLRIFSLSHYLFCVWTICLHFHWCFQQAITLTRYALIGTIPPYKITSVLWGETRSVTASHVTVLSLLPDV
jgi:hypothetical protein